MGRVINGWTPLPLRLALGASFIYHGFPKLFTVGGHEQTVGMLGGIGVPAASSVAWFLGGLEVIGGALLILGLLTRPIALLLAIEMGVALFRVHWPNGFSFMHVTGMSPTGPVFGLPGWEVPLLFLTGTLALVIGGAGNLSIDAAVTGRRRHSATDPYGFEDEPRYARAG